METPFFERKASFCGLSTKQKIRKITKFFFGNLTIKGTTHDFIKMMPCGTAHHIKCAFKRGRRTLFYILSPKWFWQKNKNKCWKKVKHLLRCFWDIISFFPTNYGKTHEKERLNRGVKSMCLMITIFWIPVYDVK